jgi:hypothetical protein
LGCRRVVVREAEAADQSRASRDVTEPSETLALNPRHNVLITDPVERALRLLSVAAQCPADVSVRHPRCPFPWRGGRWRLIARLAIWRGQLPMAGIPKLTLPWSPSSNNSVRYCEACLPDDGAPHVGSRSPPSSNRRTRVLPGCCRSIYVTWDSPSGREPHYAAQSVRSVWVCLASVRQKPDRFSAELMSTIYT